MTGGCVMHVEANPCQPFLPSRRWGAARWLSEMSFIMVASFGEMKSLSSRPVSLSVSDLVTSPCVTDGEIPVLQVKTHCHAVLKKQFTEH